MKGRVVALIGGVSSPTAPPAVLTKYAPTGLHPPTSTLELPFPRASQNLARDKRLGEILLLPSLFRVDSEDLGGPEGSDPRTDPGSGESSVRLVPPALGVDCFALQVFPGSGEGARGRFKVLTALGQPLEAPLQGLGALDLPVYPEVVELPRPIDELLTELGDCCELAPVIFGGDSGVDVEAGGGVQGRGMFVVPDPPCSSDGGVPLDEVDAVVRG